MQYTNALTDEVTRAEREVNERVVHFQETIRELKDRAQLSKEKIQTFKHNLKLALGGSAVVATIFLVTYYVIKSRR